MKKITMLVVLAFFSLSTFASDIKGETTAKEKAESKLVVAKKSESKSTIESKKASALKELECTPSSYKHYHYVTCPGPSWYTVDWVDTIETRCENGQAVRYVWHWEQNPNLVCSH